MRVPAADVGDPGESRRHQVVVVPVTRSIGEMAPGMVGKRALQVDEERFPWRIARRRDQIDRRAQSGDLGLTSSELSPAGAHRREPGADGAGHGQVQVEDPEVPQPSAPPSTPLAAEKRDPGGHDAGDGGVREAPVTGFQQPEHRPGIVQPAPLRHRVGDPSAQQGGHRLEGHRRGRHGVPKPGRGRSEACEARKPVVIDLSLGGHQGGDGKLVPDQEDDGRRSAGRRRDGLHRHRRMLVSDRRPQEEEKGDGPDEQAQEIAELPGPGLARVEANARRRRDRRDGESGRRPEVRRREAESGESQQSEAEPQPQPVQSPPRGRMSSAHRLGEQHPHPRNAEEDPPREGLEAKPAHLVEPEELGVSSQLVEEGLGDRERRSRKEGAALGGEGFAADGIVFRARRTWVVAHGGLRGYRDRKVLPSSISIPKAQTNPRGDRAASSLPAIMRRRRASQPPNAE